MNLPALIRALGAKGMSADEIADVLEASSPKSTGAERTRRWREKREAEAVTVTPVTVTGVTPVTKDAPAPVHTRGENNLSRLVDKPNLTTPDSASVPDLDWPEGDKPSRAYLDQLEAALLDAVGPALASAAIAPKVKVLGPILALGRTGQGPPCDLQTDVLPTIRARAAKAAPCSVKSWDFFRDACLEARDRRLSGAGALGQVVALPRGQGPPRLTEQIGAEHAESKRIALEKLSAQNG